MIEPIDLRPASGGDIDALKEGLLPRGEWTQSLVDECQKYDREWIQITYKGNQLRREHNQLAAQLKHFVKVKDQHLMNQPDMSEKERTSILERKRAVDKEINRVRKQEFEAADHRQRFLQKIPNVVKTEFYHPEVTGVVNTFFGKGQEVKGNAPESTEDVFGIANALNRLRADLQGHELYRTLRMKPQKSDASPKREWSFTVAGRLLETLERTQKSFIARDLPRTYIIDVPEQLTDEDEVPMPAMQSLNLAYLAADELDHEDGLQHVVKSALQALRIVVPPSVTVALKGGSELEAKTPTDGGLPSHVDYKTCFTLSLYSDAEQIHNLEVTLTSHGNFTSRDCGLVVQGRTELDGRKVYVYCSFLTLTWQS
eukprot:Clim_evm85s156 gene=Clim_evmTU85s156